MTYENIRFNRPNMALHDGYYYMMDHDRDVLFAKLDDGGTAFTYPLDRVIESSPRSMEYVHGDIWTLQVQGASQGINIRRWSLDNNIATIEDEFIYANNTVLSGITHDFDSYAMTIEHYDTKLSTTVSAGDTVIQIDKYYNTVVVSGSILTLGPNSSEESEDVIVISVSGTDITLVSGTVYGYAIDDEVKFYNNLWVFNDYYGQNASAGGLFKFNAHTGEYLNSWEDAEYNGITACTFGHVLGPSLSSYVDSLIYVKGVNAVYLNPNNLDIYATMVMDNIRANGTTVIPVYDLAIQGNSLYRLQDEGTYYGTDNDWGTQYNYVVSPIRRFINTIAVAAYPIILPANGHNITQITSLVTDQYGDGAQNTPIFFTDTDDTGYITINPAYTETFFGTGEAISYYRAGVTIQAVTIEGTATQFD